MDVIVDPSAAAAPAETPLDQFGRRPKVTTKLPTRGIISYLTEENTQ